jgi:hypothetical protein
MKSQKYFIDPNPAYEVLQGFTVYEETASEQMPKLVERLSSKYY